MATTETLGLIIKAQNVGENDRLVTVLTRDMGLVRAFAPGALRFRSKNLCATQLLSYSRLRIFHGRDTYKIDDAQTVKVFFGLRESIEGLALSAYFCELMNNFAPVAEQSDGQLSLMLNCLHFLCEGGMPRRLIKAVFELRLCRLSGYMPDLAACSGCGADEDEMYFDTVNGVLYCAECMTRGCGGCERLNSGVKAAMRHIVYGEEKKLFSFSLKRESELILANASERFIIAQADRAFKTLEFYKSVDEG